MAAREEWLTAIAIVLGVAVAATAEWAVASGPQPVDCYPHSAPGSIPIGTALAIATPTEESVGADHWYNFSVQAAGGGLHFNNLLFQVQTSSGSVVDPGSGWTFNAYDVHGLWADAYELTGATAGTWSGGGTALLSSGMTLSLFATPGSLSGDTLAVTQTGTFQNGCPSLGSASVSIP